MNAPELIVIGGGAAGFFAALAAAEANPSASITLIERSAHLLAKVKISGGGRCNVTNHCFDPAELVRHYPRGGSALRGPFTRFQPRDTMQWFESRGVSLKTEPDNRVFPVTDRSETIIDCLRQEAERARIRVRINVLIQKIERVGERFRLDAGADTLECDALVIATGSNPQGWAWAKAFGHTLVPPVPSLFTLTVQDERLEGLAGLSVAQGEVSLEGTRLRQKGPVLITHWGLSGPAVLKLSAWGARELHEKDYHAAVKVNWSGEKPDALLARLKKKRELHANNLVAADNLPEFPRRLWARLAVASAIPEKARWAEVGNEHMRALTKELTAGVFQVRGKGAFKEEFVTAGGVKLDEVDFRTMESKHLSRLYFAGEVLDIDGETGGFNFQSAWTTGWIAGEAAVTDRA